MDAASSQEAGDMPTIFSLEELPERRKAGVGVIWNAKHGRA